LGAVQALLLRQGSWEAAEPVRPLGNIGDGEPGGPPKAPNVLRLFSQNQAEQTGLSASVAAAQAQPLTMLQCEADREVCRPSVVEDHQVTALQKPLAVVPKGAQLQTVRPLHILKQRGLFLDGPLLAGLQILCPLHQLCGLVPQVAPVRTQSGISAAILALLHPVGPEGGPAGRLLQAADLSPQGLISAGPCALFPGTRRKSSPGPAQGQCGSEPACGRCRHPERPCRGTPEGSRGPAPGGTGL